MGSYRFRCRRRIVLSGSPVGLPKSKSLKSQVQVQVQVQVGRVEAEVKEKINNKFAKAGGLREINGSRGGRRGKSKSVFPRNGKV